MNNIYIRCKHLKEVHPRAFRAYFDSVPRPTRIHAYYLILRPTKKEISRLSLE